MDDLVFASAVTLAESIASRRVSSVEVVDAFIDRIARYNPHLNAIVTIDEPSVRDQARRADEALARGENRGPLHGVPFTLKDVHLTAGVRTTSGHPDFTNNVPAEDGPVSARLKRAGGILMGKSHVDLFPNNPLGRCNNPWDVARTPGGSSSGSAAGVAAGLTPFDVGTDVGGVRPGTSAFLRCVRHAADGTSRVG